MATEALSAARYALETTATALESIQQLGIHSEWGDPTGLRVIADSFGVESEFELARAGNRSGLRRFVAVMTELSGNPVDYSQPEPGALVCVEAPMVQDTAESEARLYAVYDLRRGPGTEYIIRIGPEGNTSVDLRQKIGKDGIIGLPKGCILTLFQIFPTQGQATISDQRQEAQRELFDKITSTIAADRRSGRFNKMVAKLLPLFARNT